MVETWYFRDLDAPLTCPDSSTKLQSDTVGTSSKSLDITTVKYWARQETARSIVLGDWTVTANITTAGGGGQGNKVTCKIERYNDSCVLQETILNQQLSMTKGSTKDYVFQVLAYAQVDITVNDFISISFERTAGGRAQTINYDNSDPDDSLLINPIQVAGTTPISNTMDYRYDIFQLISNPIDIRYDMSGAVSNGMDLRYDLLNTISNTNDMRYDIFNMTSNTISLEYDMDQLATNTLDIIYDMSGSVSNAVDLKYNILNQISNTNTILYDILSNVSNNITTQYDIAAKAAKAANIQYDIRQLANNTLTTQYDITEIINNTLSAVYDVYNTISSSKDIRYDIRNVILNTLETIYEIINQLNTVNNTLDIQYGIASFNVGGGTSVFSGRSLDKGNMDKG